MSIRHVARKFVDAYWDKYKTQAGDEDQDLLAVSGPLDEAYTALVRAIVQDMCADTSKPNESSDNG